MPENLDRDIILTLLAKADTKWFISHTGSMNYREHLVYVAKYIVENYRKEYNLARIKVWKGKSGT